jgi:hypothetical protein
LSEELNDNPGGENAKIQARFLLDDEWEIGESERSLKTLRGNGIEFMSWKNRENTEQTEIDGIDGKGFIYSSFFRLFRFIPYVP